MKRDEHLDVSELAESIRQATIRAAIRAYEDAGFQGLCEEGRWEAAVSAMRSLDLKALAGRRPEDGDATASKHAEQG